MRARCRRLGWLCGLALVAVLSIGAATASAAAPPELKALKISPSAINTMASSQTVTVKAEIASAAGFSTGSVAFESPTGGQSTERVSLSKVSGTENLGEWEATVTFKRYIKPGTWRISTLDLADKEGNQVHLSSTQLEAGGFAHTVEVTSTEDNEPPLLAGLSFLPTTINTKSSNQTVTVTAHITDNLSGFASGYIDFKSPNGTRFTEKASFTKVSGTETDGTYEAKVTFHQYIAPGPWKVAFVHLADNVGNEVTIPTRRLQAKGFAETVNVESIEDEAPPVLAGLSLSSSSVNTESSNQTVTVGAHITDDLSGVAAGQITFESPNGKQVTSAAEFTKVSGTETDGMYEATVTFQQFIQSGAWKVRALKLEDNVDNEVSLSASLLEAKGLPATVTVTSKEDTAPPALAGFKISPSSVNTTGSLQSVTVTAEITDNLSGFSHGSVAFVSPNGKVSTNVASFTKVSGTATNGVYEAKVTFKQFLQSGKWKVSNVSLVDAVGNEANFSAAQLEAKIFPATVEVTSTEDTEPPALAGLTITPTTINTAAASEIVILTAHITDNLSGFKTGFIAFESENGKRKTGTAAFNTRLSGTETDGTWEAAVIFKQSLESGTWKVSGLTLTDNATNEVTLSAAQLEAKGLPDKVVDETGAPPTVRRVNPRKGPAAGETTVTITGTNFAGVTAVKFGSKEAIGFKFVSLDQITAISPQGTTGIVDVTVTTPNGTSAITPRDHFKYERPTVTSVTPNHGPRTGGTEVTITGTGFEPGSSGTSFRFGSLGTATSVNCSSRTSCTAKSPAAARPGGVDVLATVAGKRSIRTALDRFNYT
jgi:hypothetical protein